MIFSVIFSGSLLTLFKCFKMCFISFDLIAMFIYINPNTWIDVCFWPQQSWYLLSKLNFSPFLQNCFSFCISLNFPGDSAVKNPPVNAGDEGSIPGEDPLGKETPIHSSILALEIAWTEELGGLQSMGLQKSWTWLSD